jgi:hypothetical protein
MNRRNFLTQTALVGTGITILPSGVIAGTRSPNDKLNIALIGVWGRAKAHYGWLAEQNVVALCDINEAHFAHALKEFPNAKTYIDWRQCLDHKGLDAVVICTADHHHAFISNWALNRDLHVYCEKPCAIGVEEARVLRKNWLSKKGKLASQVGTQMHAQDNYARIKEMIRDGAIGDLQSAIAWGNRKLPRDGYFKAEGTPPRRPTLGPMAWTLTGTSIQPKIFCRQPGGQLPGMEHVLGLGRRPNRRHGKPLDGPRLEQHRRHRPNLDPSHRRPLQPGSHPG